MTEKMRKSFQQLEGGLFTEVEKADVGSAYEKLGNKDVDLMGWADPFAPDYSLPDHIEAETMKYLKSNAAAHYIAPIGDSELKKIIAQKLIKKNQLDVDPERNILITPGSDSGLFYSMLCCLNEGDEVLIPSPSYPNNFQNCELIGAIPVPVRLKRENNYQININDLEKKLTKHTKMLVLTHPNNPTTTVYNKKTLENLVEFIIKNDLILVCDQAFEDFTFENDMYTPASFPEMWERTITVFSVSKGMGLSGYRVGYVVTNDAIMDKLYAAAVSVLGATNTIAQKAVISAFEKPDFMKDFQKVFDERRKLAFEILNKIPNVSLMMPESGFLCWVDISKIGDSSEIVSYLINDAKVAVNDGVNYGPGGEGHIRIVLGVYKDTNRIENALNKIKNSLIKYQEKSND